MEFVLGYSDAALLEALTGPQSFDDPLVRKRGFIQVVDGDPSRLDLPPCCLPLYLPNGQGAKASGADFESRLRRMTMLDAVRRSGIRDLVIVTAGEQPVPKDLEELWASGFRPFITFLLHDDTGESRVSKWFDEREGAPVIQTLTHPLPGSIADIVARFQTTYPDDRHLVRVRDATGRLHTIDVSDVDEPERPVLQNYSLVEERDVLPLTEAELHEEEFIEFFRNPESSWRPYAAGVPWMRDSSTLPQLRKVLRALDAEGADENRVAYIRAEAGAGRYLNAGVYASAQVRGRWLSGPRGEVLPICAGSSADRK